MSKILLAAVFLFMAVQEGFAVCTASITVSSNADSGAGTLRQAIADICPGGTIDFASPGMSGATITLTDQMIIDKDITIDGSSLASQVSIDSNHGVGGPSGFIRAFIVNAGISATLRNLTIKNGYHMTGGGIVNNGTLTVTNCSFLDNNGNAYANNGGAISSAGDLTVNGSTFIGNTARSGGAIATGGTTIVTNSTFSGNSAVGDDYEGGAIVNGGASLWLRNNTFSGNSAKGYLATPHRGASLWNRNASAAIYMANNIMANNPDAGGTECDLGVTGSFTSLNNLIEGGGCGASITSDPNIDVLAYNGGPTQTMALLSGSPAINAADNATCAAAPVNGLDQRGIARPQGGSCDIGAFESSLVEPGSLGKSLPTDTASGLSSSLTISWSASTDSTDYEYCYDTSNDNACSGAWTSTGGATSATISVSNSTTYYWQVRARKGPAATYADGAPTTYWSFTTAPGPAVTGISPSSGPAAGGTSVTITGTNLADATAVKFGGNDASITSNTDTQIIATSPAGSGTVDITITTAYGKSVATSADQFAYVAPPTVTGVSPRSGLASGGTSVTITGTSLSLVTSVKFGSADASGYTVNSDTQIVATSPSGSPGTVDITVTNISGISATGSADQFTFITSPATRYAKPGGLAIGACEDWASACDLQHALGISLSGDEIWAAAGTYKPTTGTDRTASFILKNGMAIYGGFAGTETVRSQRDYIANVSILSGDLLGNDNSNIVYSEPTRADNSYHVVTATSTDATAILDGFTITGGNANVSSGNSGLGAGIINYGYGSPTLTNVTISRNTSLSHGGGMYNYNYSSPTLTNVTISNNRANAYGGGMYNYAFSSPTLTNVTISSNTANSYGGGMYNGVLSSPALTNVTLHGNQGTWGGAMYSVNSAPTLTNVTISNNSATINGGGSYSSNSAPKLTNVTISNNSAVQYGGGLHLYGGGQQPTITNVTISNNSAGNRGGGIYVAGTMTTATNVTISNNSAGSYGGGIYVAGPTLSVSNSIIAGNTSVGGPDVSGALTSLGYNLIKNTSGATITGTTTGNIYSIDPLLGTLGSYGGLTQTIPLLPGSPAIDAGDDAACAAAPVNNLDQRGITRPAGTHCDIGAFESQGFSISKTGGDNQSAQINTAFGTPLGMTISSGFGEPVDGGIITFTAPSSGASVTFAPTTTATISGSVVTLGVTANGNVGGPYAVTALASGASSAEFSLTNSSVKAATTTTIISHTPDPSIVGQSVTVGFTVTSGAGTPTGNVTVDDGEGHTCTADITIGSCSLTPSSPGTKALTATYEGDSNFSGSSGTASQAVNSAPPTVSGISPSGGSTGGGTVVTITGANFTGATSVMFGSADAAGFTVNSDVSVSATSPAGVGTVHITVTTAGGTSATSSADQFTYCPASITVSNTSGSGAGTLRQAIADLCPGGTITFDSSLSGGTITLADQMIIDKNMTIDGSSLASQVSIDSNHGVGGPSGFIRAFIVNGGVTAALKGLTIKNGYHMTGGGLVNIGTLTVNNCNFLDNNGNAYANNGGAISSNGDLTVNGSTFIGNTARSGGAIATGGTTIVTNSTFAGNSAVGDDYEGGAIVNGGASLWLRNNTFSGNTAKGNYLLTPHHGASLWNRNASAVIYMANNIMANNPDAGGTECDLGTTGSFTSINNLVEGGGCGASLTGDPLLGTLSSYGGATQTLPLLPGSPAIDAGDDTVCAALPVSNLDQRGVSRPQGSHCDIGAFESRGFSMTKTGGDNQTAVLNTSFAIPLSVTLSEIGGSVLPGANITFTAPASGPSGIFANGTRTTVAPTNSSGVATATVFTANTVTGPYSVTTSAGGETNAGFSLTNTASTAATLIVEAPGTATGGLAFTINVTAKDAYGNVATSYTGTVHFTSPSDSQAVLPGNSTLTNGTGTFSVTLKTAGMQSVIATDTQDSQLTGSANMLVSLLTVTPHAVSSGGTLNCTPTSLLYGAGFSCTACPSKGYDLQILRDNTVIKTSSCTVDGNCYTYAATGVTESHTVEATYQNYPVILLFGVDSDCFPTVQAAADAAQAGDRIQIQAGAGPYVQSLNFNRSGISASLEGGYDTGFASWNGTTTLSGSVTVTRGTLSIREITVR